MTTMRMIKPPETRIIRPVSAAQLGDGVLAMYLRNSNIVLVHADAWANRDARLASQVLGMDKLVLTYGGNK